MSTTTDDTTTPSEGSGETTSETARSWPSSWA